MTGGGDLVLDGVVKHFDSFTLGPLQTRFERGKKYGLLGPNGAGKTTLLNCIAGQARIGSGQIVWKDQPLRWGHWRYRQDVAFIAETPYLYDELTVAENFHFASEIYERWDRTFASHWAQRLKLDVDQPFGRLSKGTKVKAALVAGLAHRSDLILLDEPTAGLDPDAREEILGLLGELAGAETVTIVSSHLFEDTERLADEVKILRDGRFVFESALGQVAETTLVRLPSGPLSLGGLPIVGRWTSKGEQWVLLGPSQAPVVPADGLLAHALERRPATLRDLYFAFGRD